MTIHWISAMGILILIRITIIFKPYSQKCREVTSTTTARIDYHCSAGGLSGLADGR